MLSNEINGTSFTTDGLQQIYVTREQAEIVKYEKISPAAPQSEMFLCPCVPQNRRVPLFS